MKASKRSRFVARTPAARPRNPCRQCGVNVGMVVANLANMGLSINSAVTLGVGYLALGGASLLLFDGLATSYGHNDLSRLSGSVNAVLFCTACWASFRPTLTGLQYVRHQSRGFLGTSMTQN